MQQLRMLLLATLCIVIVQQAEAKGTDKIAKERPYPLVIFLQGMVLSGPFYGCREISALRQVLNATSASEAVEIFLRKAELGICFVIDGRARIVSIKGPVVGRNGNSGCLTRVETFIPGHGIVAIYIVRPKESILPSMLNSCPVWDE